MVPMSRESSYETRIDRAIRSFGRSRFAVVVQGVTMAVLAIGGVSMMLNVLAHVIGG